MPPTHGLGVSKKSFCLSAANKELDESQIAKAIKPEARLAAGLREFMSRFFAG